MSKMIELSNAQVEIKDILTWMQAQEIEAIFAEGAKIGPEGKPTGFNGAVLLQAKIKLMEMLIVKIKEGDKEFGFSREWVEKLSVVDGNKLSNALDEVSGKKA